MDCYYGKKEFIFKIEKACNGLLLCAYDPITKKVMDCYYVHMTHH